MHIPIYILIGVGCITWLIFLLAIVKFCHFFREFEKFKARNDVELNNIDWHLKKSEETREKILIETQRTGKLLYDLYKGNKISFYSEIEYKDEDALRHKKSEEHLHNGIIVVNPPTHPGQSTNRNITPLTRKTEDESRPRATDPPPVTDPHQQFKVQHKVMTDDPHKNEVAPF